MCKQCSILMEKYYPDMPMDERHELLMGATAFPFGGPETVEKQLIQLKENNITTLGSAICFAEEQMDKEYYRYKAWEKIKLSAYFQ